MQKLLFSLKDEKYRDFNSKIIPNIKKEKIIWVRVPVLKKIAKDFKNMQKERDFLEKLPHNFHEENLLHVYFINLEKDFEKCLKSIWDFAYFIDNWMVCDAFRPKILEKNKQKLLEKIKIFLKSEKEYEIRLWIWFLHYYFLKKDFDKKYLKMVEKINVKKYYVEMMQAWFFAEALFYQENEVLEILQNKKLSKFVQNKTIQKAKESKKINEKLKKYLENFKLI